LVVAVDEQAPGPRSLDAPTPAMPLTVAAGSEELDDPLPQLSTRSAATGPSDQQQPSTERAVLRRLQISVTDEKGAPIAGAQLDVEPRGVGADSTWLEVTTAGGLSPHDGTLGLSAGSDEALVVSVLAAPARELFVRAFADGWRPETRIVQLTETANRQGDVVLVLRRGTSVSGRLVDGDGKAVPRGQLSVGADESSAHVQSLLATDSTGHFEAAIRTSGAVALHAACRGVGQSVSRTIIVAEGRRTELGDFVLLGPGRISGHVRLRDGTPLPKVSVAASLQDTARGPGLRNTDARCDDAGRFELTGLSVGSFDLSVVADESGLPDASGRLVATGTEDYELVVDAVLLTVRAVDGEGSTVPMASVEMSSVVLPHAPAAGDDGGSSSTSTPFATPIESHTWLVPGTRSYLLRAHDVDGVGYFGVFESGQPSGRVTIDLVARPSTLGTIVVRADSPELPAEAALRVDALVTGSRDVVVVSKADRGVRERGAQLVREIGGLMPGSYDLSLSLERGGAVGLVEGRVALLVRPGEVTEVALETYVGGTLELQVDSSRPGHSRTFVHIESRLVGSAEWRPLVVSFLERDDAGQVVAQLNGARLLLGGPAAQSAPLRSGDHELRLTEEHHEPLTSTFGIDPGATTSLRLLLKSAGPGAASTGR
jgi:hypothetical protein